MHSRRASRHALVVLLLGLGSIPRPSQSAEPAPQLPKGIAREELPREAGLTKIVLVAGSNAFKPGEHEYVAGCAALMDLLRQTPGVFPVLALDWPVKSETLADAKSIVMFFDGAEKHALLKDDRLERIERMAGAGVGLVSLHQDVDVPKDQGERVRGLLGGTFEKGFSMRAHWVTKFESFPDHPITRGVTPFTIDDGWLFKLRFVPELKGVTPLLRTVSPKAPVSLEAGSEDIVSWAYDRPGGGRSFAFTGGHLHRSLAEEGYRRFLVNGILWSADVKVPPSGAPVALAPARLDSYLQKPPAR